MPITKPTRGKPRTQDEMDERDHRDFNGSWVAGPRFIWNKAGGQYRPRTGNSNGVRKPKRSKKGPKDQPRATIVPKWARRYAAEQI